MLAALRDAGVRRVALRAAGLSPKSLSAIQVIVEQARELEGLGEGMPDIHDPEAEST